MQWHELEIQRCGLRLRPRNIAVAVAVRTESEARDTRPARNRIKLGPAGRPRTPQAVTTGIMIEQPSERARLRLEADEALTVQVKIC